jgi:hypothetical protein
LELKVWYRSIWVGGGRTADPSASLGMTKGRVALSLKFVYADDERQVPPLRFAPVLRQAGTGGMTIRFGVEVWYRSIWVGEGRTADPSASLGMTKGRMVLSLKFVPADEEQQVPFHFASLRSHSRPGQAG